MNLGHPFPRVDPDSSLDIRERDEVYAPSEDSYLLLKAIDVEGASTFLDMGTGTGLIAVHAALRSGTLATDISPFAVHLCRENADLNGVPVKVVRTDLFAALTGKFDVIAFNPPYLPDVGAEGWVDSAWSGGPDGNEVILRFLEQAGEHLAPRGRIFLLLSSHNGRSLSRAEELYDVKLLDRRSLFFEEIGVYELKHSRLSSAHKI